MALHHVENPPASDQAEAQPPQPAPATVTVTRRGLLRSAGTAAVVLLGLGGTGLAVKELGWLRSAAHATWENNHEATPTVDTAFLKNFSERAQGAIRGFLDGTLKVPKFVQYTNTGTEPDNRFIDTTAQDGTSYIVQVIDLGTYFDKTSRKYYGAFGVNDPDGNAIAVFLGKLGGTDVTPYTLGDQMYHANDVLELVPPTGDPTNNTEVVTQGGRIKRVPMPEALQQLEDKVGTRIYATIMSHAWRLNYSLLEEAPLVFQKRLAEEADPDAVEAALGLAAEGAGFLHVDDANPGRSFLERAGQHGVPGLYVDPTTQTVQTVDVNARTGIISPGPFISIVEFP